MISNVKGNFRAIEVKRTTVQVSSNKNFKRVFLEIAFSNLGRGGGGLR